MRASLEKLIFIAEGAETIFEKAEACLDGLILSITTEGDLNRVLQSINGETVEEENRGMPKGMSNLSYLETAIAKAKIYISEATLSGEDFV